MPAITIWVGLLPCVICWIMGFLEDQELGSPEFRCFQGRDKLKMGPWNMCFTHSTFCHVYCCVLSYTHWISRRETHFQAFPKQILSPLMIGLSTLIGPVRIALPGLPPKENLDALNNVELGLVQFVTGFYQEQGFKSTMAKMVFPFLWMDLTNYKTL